MPDVAYYKEFILEWKGWYQREPKSHVESIVPLVEYYMSLGLDEQRKFRLAYASVFEDLWKRTGLSLAFFDDVDCPEAGPTVGRMLEEYVKQWLSNSGGQWVKDNCSRFARAAGRTRSEAAVPALRLLIENAAQLLNEDLYSDAVLALTRVDYRLVLPYLREYVAWLTRPSQAPTGTAETLPKYSEFGQMDLTRIIAECIRQGGPSAVGELVAALRPLDAEGRKAVLAALRRANLWPYKGSGSPDDARYRMSTAGRCALRSWTNDLEDGGVPANA